MSKPKRNAYSKYKAKKVEFDGFIFDSKRECERYKVLKQLVESGQIHNLRRQVEYVLIPIQREPDTVGPKGGIKRGKVIEKACTYKADFVYKNLDGEEIVEDTKGFRTSDYIIKRKLMLKVHGIRIREV